MILCGGTGTRLWPLSRASYPKQYWPLGNTAGNDTLLQQTHQRLEGLESLGAPLLICNDDHRFIVAEQMRQIGVTPGAILLEPMGRNTAPAVAVAALQALASGEDPLLLVLAADHVIRDGQRFREAVNAGRAAAEAGRLVTFGIVPNAPETGYGYIEACDALRPDVLSPSPIARFIEKPDKSTAQQFLASGRFTWNSGMFLFRASTMLTELERFVPEVVHSCRDALEKAQADLDFRRLDPDAFSRCPNIAIDVAVMEQTQQGSVLPLAAGWSDVGSWSALWETSDKDADGNVTRGRVICEQSNDCYLRSEHRLVVGLGLKDLVVVETDDAVLIAKRDQAQNVKTVVSRLETEGSPEGKAHRKIYRPWGSYTGVVEDNRWQVKRISVKPGASLSLQMHHHRAEHWIVVKGTALVERDGEQELITENQSTYIPLGCKHRLTNPGRISVEMIEVQSGDYLGEDDIVRFDDVYGRSNKTKTTA